MENISAIILKIFWCHYFIRKNKRLGKEPENVSSILSKEHLIQTF